MKTERRMAVSDLEVREDSEKLTLTGYASTFNQPYDMGWYTETVDPKAFQRTLGRKPDVRLLINHDGLPLARTTSGTLTLESDSRGLLVSASLDATDPDVQRLAPKMARGDMNQMSFGFRTISDVWENDMSKRTLRELDLNDGDVSVVTYPANPGTSAKIRSGGHAIESLTSALTALEARGATPEEVAEVLERALRSLTNADLLEEATVAIEETEQVTSPNAEPDDAARAAVKAEVRRRRLALAG